MEPILSERDKLILEALIQEYIGSAEPIGSRTISRHWSLGLSPASVRNVMADLEEMGFLWQPHVSAGRIPTEKAFRFYVDRLLKIRKLGKREREKIREHYPRYPMEAEELLRRAALVLSSFSDYVGLVVVPALALGRLKHIHFARVGENQILAVLVSSGGIVQHKLLINTDGLIQEELDKASRYLNTELAGLTLLEVRQKILEQMQQEKSKFDTLLSQALRLGEKTLADLEQAEVYVEGKLNILNQPEFADIEKMKAIFRAFEEKSKILKLLDKSLQGPGLSIFIGSENELEEIKEMALVTSSYRQGNIIRGTLGVIGPTRMNYSRVIPVVDFVSQLVSELLED